MEENIINRAEDLSSANVRPVDDQYLEIDMKLTTEEEKYRCFLLLTNENKISTLCQQTYDEKYIKAFIENSTHFQIFRRKNTKEVIGFNLLKLKKKHKMDIILTCAVTNTKTYGTMIAFGAYKFAVRNKVKKILVAPRTPALRATFVRHGFTSYFGTEDIDEVLEKEVSALALKSGKTSHTRRNASRPRPHYHAEISELILQSNNVSNKASLKQKRKSGRHTLKRIRDE